MAKKKAAKPATDRPKRPRDPNEFAHAMIQEMTERLDGESQPPDVTPEVSRYMAALGRRGGKVGGKRRMDTLTQTRRSEIAFAAAKARWTKEKTKKP
jgi:hypothetical protein